MMASMPSVSLSEELLAGVLQHAEHLRGSVIAADAGTLEALRWSGAMPLLLRDLGVERVLALSTLWNATVAAPSALADLLSPPSLSHFDDGDSEDSEASDEDEQLTTASEVKLVVIYSGFLWDIEPQLVRLVERGVVRCLTVLSSLSERAHECADRGKMDFERLAMSIMARNAYKPRARVVQTASCDEEDESNGHQSKDDGEWDWNEDDTNDSDDAFTPSTSHQDAAAAVHDDAAPSVRVLHVALNAAPLISQGAAAASSLAGATEPSVFVLSQPQCATAFPLLLSQVQSYHRQHPMPREPEGAKEIPLYAHVRDVQSEHIPRAYRQTLKLVAHTLGEMLVHQLRLDVSDRIYALGATSLKIGHTLHRILRDLQSELTTHALQSHRPATVVVLDRTCDLVTPCSFGVSMLDRILALIPQTPLDQDDSDLSAATKNRHASHVTDIFPIHGCEPSPLKHTSAAPAAHTRFEPSMFVSSGIKWKGGATLCHPRTQHDFNSPFRSLAFRPAKLALRDLDKRLQEVEHDLVKEGKISRSASVRKQSNAGAALRGRDVVLRRVANILDAGEPTNANHSALIEIGILVLETLERMEHVQQRWDVCRERVERHNQLLEKHAAEWILPELADTVQRQAMTTKTSAMRLYDLLTLLVHGFALSTGSPLEDYTIQMIRSVTADTILEAVVVEPESVSALFPSLVDELRPLTGDSGASPRYDGDDNEWDWDDSSPKHSARSRLATSASMELELNRMQAKAVVERHVEKLLAPLTECGQHHVRMELSDANTESKSLVANVCKQFTSKTAPAVPGLEHIVDASEQLTRAGIDLLKSGFSRFGFTSGGVVSSSAVVGELSTLVVFVVGGITFQEVQEIANALSDGAQSCQVIVGSTTLTNNELLLQQLFTSL
ncbi:hypothetical protein PINS_up014021 [Pythium insidiosum]|nr:hypothetical protein PINS_up014021 [Pythium insidiosum]